LKFGTSLSLKVVSICISTGSTTYVGYMENKHSSQQKRTWIWKMLN
jgi:hypothetical protein